MEAVRQTSYNVDVSMVDSSRVNTDRRISKGRPVGEFMDELAKRLGKHYGLNDIREAL